MATNNGSTKAASEWDKKELGVLWKKQAQSSGENFLTGVINLKSLGFDQDVSVVCFSNKGKTKDTHPDIRIYLSEKKGAAKTATTAPAPRAAAASAPAPAATPAPTAAPELI